MSTKLNHNDPNLLITVIDVDNPGLGRRPKTEVISYAQLEPVCKRAWERALEETQHRAGMAIGGLNDQDFLCVGLDLRFVDRMDEFLDASAQFRVANEVETAYIEYYVACARKDSSGKYSKEKTVNAAFIPGLGMREPVQNEDLDCGGFNVDKATREAIVSFPRHWENWKQLPKFMDWRLATLSTQSTVWKDVPTETKPDEYDFDVLLQLNHVDAYKKILGSPTCDALYGILPRLALSYLGGHTSNVASESCNSTAQYVMSDFHTLLGDEILEKIVVLRDNKSAIDSFKKAYPDEAKHVTQNIEARLTQLARQYPDQKPTDSEYAEEPLPLFPLGDASTESDESDSNSGS